MSFTLAVEALHAFIQDESEHKYVYVLTSFDHDAIFVGTVITSVGNID